MGYNEVENVKIKIYANNVLLGDETARKLLINHYMPFIEELIKDRYKNELHKKQLIDVAIDGLMEAVKEFQRNKKIYLDRRAKHNINKKIVNYTK